MTILIKFKKRVKIYLTKMISIIVTHHKTPILLKLCLKSILENVKSEYEIIISDSQTKEIIKEIIEEKIFRENKDKITLFSFKKNVGYAKLVNKGIKAAKGDKFLILNADIIILNDSVKKMVDFMDKNPKVGIIGPQLLTFSNQVQNSYFKFPTIGSILARRTFLGKIKWGEKKLNYFLEEIDNNNPKEVDWVQGSAMLVNKKAVDKVGLMDERYFMYFEDTDWCRSFWEKGYKVIYLPLAQMSHYYYRSSKKWNSFFDILFNKYTRIHLKSAFKYFWKWRKG